MKTSLITITLFIALIGSINTLKAQQPDPFPNNPRPLQSTVGYPGYIGTDAPTGNTISGLSGPTGYYTGGDIPITQTGQVVPSGMRGPSNYIAPKGINGQTGVTGIPGQTWP